MKKRGKGIKCTRRRLISKQNGNPRRQQQDNKAVNMNVHVRLDVAWYDCVDSNTLFTPLIRQRLYHLRNTTFGHRVSRHGKASLERKKGSEVYYGAAAAGEHMRPGSLGEEECGLEVGGEHLVITKDERMVDMSVSYLRQDSASEGE